MWLASLDQMQRNVFCFESIAIDTAVPSLGLRDVSTVLISGVAVVGLVVAVRNLFASIFGLQMTEGRKLSRFLGTAPASAPAAYGFRASTKSISACLRLPLALLPRGRCGIRYITCETWLCPFLSFPHYTRFIYTLTLPLAFISSSPSCEVSMPVAETLGAIAFASFCMFLCQNANRYCQNR
jgi:hypothetical protein